MSHEIRTPINAVLGMNELILRETDSDRIRKEPKRWLASLDQVRQSLESIGMEDVKPTVESFSFAGKEHASIACSSTYMGVPLFERQVFVKVGRYIGIVTSFGFSQEDADSFLGFFSAA